MAFLHGKTGSVAIGGAVFAFGHWRCPMKNTPGKVTNFTGAGFRQLIAGITEATITIDGPYDAGNMPFVLGTTYIWTLGYTTNIALVVTGILTGIEPDVDVEKEQRMTLTVDQTGPFTAAVV